MMQLSSGASSAAGAPLAQSPAEEETLSSLSGIRKVEKFIDTGVIFVTTDTMKKPKAENVLY